MVKYTVRLYAKAYRDLEEIYNYIAKNLTEPETASNLLDALEEAIYSLELFPMRAPLRQTGTYANSGYRQLFVKKM